MFDEVKRSVRRSLASGVVVILLVTLGFGAVAALSENWVGVGKFVTLAAVELTLVYHLTRGDGAV